MNTRADTGEGTVRDAERYPVVSAAAGALAILLLGTLTTSLARSEDPCGQMDRMVVLELAPLLDRANAEDPRLIHRAVSTLRTAREYCDRGWTDAGLTLYRALQERIDSYRRVGAWREE
jgi:hypothetical protein